MEIGFNEIRKRSYLKLELDKEAQKVAALERKEKAVKEYTRLCKKKGRFLTARELKAGGFKYLVGVIKSNLSMNELKDLSKLDFFRKKSFTKDEVITLYKKECQHKGYFLTARTLVNRGHRDLVAAIKYWGDFTYIRQQTQLKFQVRRLDDQYTIPKALGEFRRLSIRNGSFFSKNDFIAVGMTKLAWFIQNNGGYRHFQRESKLNISKMHKINQKST